VCPAVACCRPPRCPLVAAGVSARTGSQNSWWCKVSDSPANAFTCGSDCTLSLWVPTAPVIESCRGIRVRAWCVAYPSLAAPFEAAGLDSSSPNKIGEVYDFTPPASGESPHWTLEEEGDEAEMTEIVVEGCDLGPCEVRGLSHLEKWGRVVPSPEPCDGDGREL
jgi:hypothetical protein